MVNHIKAELGEHFTLTTLQEEDIDQTELRMALVVLQLKEAYKYAKTFEIVKANADPTILTQVVDQIMELLYQC